MLQDNTKDQAGAMPPQFSKKIKRNLYRWHKISGLVVLIPLILWTVSGLMHPMMAHWFKVPLRHDKIEAASIDTNMVKLSPQQILKQNAIASFYNFRLVQIADSCFYQVKMLDKSIRYFNAVNGLELKNGDQAYAHYLAAYFFGEKQASIVNTRKLEAFDFNYQYINRLLPVYQIRFNDDRETDIYVETFGSRLATYTDTQRRSFLWVFNNFHTWSFLQHISSDTLRFSIMIGFLTIIIFAGSSGIIIYLLLWKKFKRPKNAKARTYFRRYHRQLGIFTSIFMLMFAFSGAYHATTKFDPGKETPVAYRPVLKASSLRIEPRHLNLFWDRLQNISVVAMKKDTIYQVSYQGTEDYPEETAYYNTHDGALLENGDVVYAKFLTRKFAYGKDTDMQVPECCVRPNEESNGPVEILDTEKVYHFTREYSFANKRLPVIKVSVKSADNKRYFIETTHSLLAARVNDADMREGYSFAFLHKFFFMEWAGKGIRDFTMAVSALAVLIVSLLGLAILFKK